MDVGGSGVLEGPGVYCRKQKIDHIDLLVYLLSNHECFRINVVAASFLNILLMRESDIVFT